MGALRQGTSKPEKKLTIVIFPDTALPPEVTFEGEWYGREINRLGSIIYKAYKRHIRDRKAKVASEIEEKVEEEKIEEEDSEEGETDLTTDKEEE